MSGGCGPAASGATPAAAGFDAIVRTTVGDEVLQRWLADYQVVSEQWHDAALAELGDVEAWRDVVSAVREHTVAHLDRYLSQFADRVEAGGGHVFFAATASEAREYVVGVARRAGAQHIVKAKSMVTSEIDLNPALEALGAEVAETDLGEYIIQLSGEKPYHITGPALHKTLPQIRKLFSQEAGAELPEDPDSLAAFARSTLREKFLRADMGISGANFGIASTGTIVLVTNEGNGRMSTTLPRTHVVVMGMERLVPDWGSLEPVLTMLTRAGTGERATTYVSAITGPRREDDVDGPEELHVVIVDNGRSRLLGTRYQSVLHCIRCGYCADCCPVYRTMGGHAYESPYTGPIGAVLTPLLDGIEGREHLPFASTLCGACQAECPAKVPLADLLLQLRADVVEAHRSPASWRVGFKAFAAVSRRPRLWTVGLARGRQAGAVGGAPRQDTAAPSPDAGVDGLPRPPAALADQLQAGLAAAAAGLPARQRTLMADPNRFLQRVSARLRRSTPKGDAAFAPPAASSPGLAPSWIAPPLPVPRDREGMLRLFADRLLELHGTATLTPTRDVALGEIARMVHDRGEAIACPPTLMWKAIDDLWVGDPRAAGFGLSEADWGIAASATVVLFHRREQARGYSLIPPAVGFLLPASRVMPQLGPVLAAIQETADPLPACITFVSGASHSADIAGVPCFGVHGPGEVHVWLIDDE